MGKSREHRRRNARGGGAPPAYPPSPSSTSSSDFEFTVSLSPTSRRTGAANLCPADELFYKGQLLPLHPSPRISMVRSLLLASSSSSSCSDTTASRDSSGSDSTVSGFSTESLVLGGGECDSSRPSSVTEEEADTGRVVVVRHHGGGGGGHHGRHKYYSLASLANRKTAAKTGAATSSGSSAKEVFKKYVKKVKPLYEKLDQKLSALQQHRSQQQQQKAAARQELRKKTFSFSVRRGDKSAMERIIMSASASRKERDQLAEEEEEPGRGSDGGAPIYAHGSFSGNLRYLRRRQSADAAASCPSSMRSSPSHSGLLYPRQRGTGGGAGGGRAAHFGDVSPAPAAALATSRFPPSSWSSSSSMEELQSAIQGAIAHCKSSMTAGQPNQKAPSTAVGEQSSGVPTELPAATTTTATT
ncbi:hypothetical protein Taro_004760 [Colocasia esculenta]|uniref:Uncharacterized protein n=1 Tax=Colocasia esculenta TaxID=4460 RepID=A0A843TSI5_COLES|nr:hypothetical protein [Colocasia esculenta]